MSRKAIKRSRIASAILLVALLAALFFAARLTVYTIRWSDPARRDVPVAGWMTPGYVANSWEIPRDLVFETLGLAEPRKITLEDLAAEKGMPLEKLIDQIKASIEAYRTVNP